MSLPTSGWLDTPQLNPIDSGPLPVPHTAFYYDPNNPPLEVVEDAPGAVTFVSVGQGQLVTTGRAGRNVEREPVMVAKLQFNDVYGILLVDEFTVPESPGLLSGSALEELDLGLDVDPSRLDDYFLDLPREELDLGLTIESVQLLRAGCTMGYVVEQAQMESGLDARQVTTLKMLSEHILKFRQTLLSWCAGAWQDVEDNDLEIPIPLTGGWGGPWGYDWGGTGANPVLTFDQMEAIWEIEARRISDGTWVKAHAVPPDDQTIGDRPLLLRAGEIILLDFAAKWAGQYDMLRLVGIAVPGTTGIEFDETLLEPNALVGPLFCRCLVLEAARWLALKGELVTEAGSLAAELRAARRDLLAQAASHNQSRTTRQ